MWNYLITDRGKAPFRSWGYKTKEKAEAAKKGDMELCQIVTRYFDHTDCKTTYGDVFCDACGTVSRSALDFASVDAQRAIGATIDRWRSELQGMMGSLRSIDRTGAANRYQGIGNATREYLSAIWDANLRVRSLSRLASRLEAGESRLSDQIQKDILGLDEARNRSGYTKGLALAETSNRNVSKPTASPTASQVTSGTWQTNLGDHWKLTVDVGGGEARGRLYFDCTDYDEVATSPISKEGHFTLAFPAKKARNCLVAIVGGREQPTFEDLDASVMRFTIRGESLRGFVVSESDTSGFDMGRRLSRRAP